MSKLDIGVGEEFPLEEGRQRGRHRHRHRCHHRHDAHAHTAALLEALKAWRRQMPKSGGEA
ncbi:MAG TPA: hypothetical protein VHC40_06625 [Rhizomicrobium sp.]|nr:hypothetical protein [Rhizomicrobium sp.]